MTKPFLMILWKHFIKAIFSHFILKINHYFTLFSVKSIQNVLFYHNMYFYISERYHYLLHFCKVLLCQRPCHAILTNFDVTYLIFIKMLKWFYLIQKLHEKSRKFLTLTVTVPLETTFVSKYFIYIARFL